MFIAGSILIVIVRAHVIIIVMRDVVIVFVTVSSVFGIEPNEEPTLDGSGLCSSRSWLVPYNRSQPSSNSEPTRERQPGEIVQQELPKCPT